MSNESCQEISLAQALDRLPDPQGEQSVLLFEHGSLVFFYGPEGGEVDGS